MTPVTLPSTPLRLSVLYLAIGMLDWTDEDDTTPSASPGTTPSSRSRAAGGARSNSSPEHMFANL
jgi:hypothetical protein